MYSDVNNESPYSSMAIVSLVLGIIGVLGGFLLCGLVPVAAVLTGMVALQRTKNGLAQGHKLAVTGSVLGYIGIGMAVVFAIVGFA